MMLSTTEQINIRMSELNQKLIQIRSDEMGQEELLEQRKKELQEVSEELKAKLSERAEIEQKIQELQQQITLESVWMLLCDMRSVPLPDAFVPM